MSAEHKTLIHNFVEEVWNKGNFDAVGQYFPKKLSP